MSRGHHIFCTSIFLAMIGTAYCQTGDDTGQILFEYWFNIPGSSVSDLTENPDYPDNPSDWEYRTSFDGRVDWKNNYGQRVRGVLTPPETGSYILWIAGDDNCQLFLSVDASFNNKTLIAEVPGYTGHLQWDKYPEQASSSIHLEAGKKYYLEALMKEAAGGDSLAVAWSRFRIAPDPVVIGGQHFSEIIPFMISQHDPGGIVTTSIGHVDVVFTEDVNELSFTVDDVTLTGPNNNIPVTALDHLGQNTWRITFPEQSERGDYTITVGPNIQSVDDALLDQDRDGIAGEATDDSYTGHFSIVHSAALSFDGVDDLVDCGQHSAFNIKNEITVEAWIKVDSFTKPWQAIVTKGDSAWRLHRNNQSNSLGFHCSVASHSWRSFGPEGRVNVNDGQWHHVAGTYDGHKASLYIDGQLDASVDETRTVRANEHPVFIGENAERPGRNWNGQIDLVRIWNRAKTQHEIQVDMLYVNPASGLTPVACWSFDEGNGQIVYDASGNGYHGKLGTSQNGDASDPEWVGSTAPIQEEDDFRIMTHTPQYALGEIDHVEVTFTKAVKTDSFTTDDLRLDGPNGPISVDSLQHNGGNVWTIEFPTQVTGGPYTLSVGPDIEDTYGNLMNQEGGRVAGEDPNDRYEGTFMLATAWFLEDTVIHSNDQTYDEGDIIVEGHELSISGNHQFNSLYLLNGASVTCSPLGIGASDGRVSLVVTADAMVDRNCSIDVVGKGYGPESGPGAGHHGESGNGGSHGGKGGLGSMGYNSVPVGQVYGSISEPMSLGSGGGNDSFGNKGGHGGGSIYLNVGGALTLNGTLNANGIRGQGLGGSGAGGSIYIVAEVINGSGQITADGPAGHSGVGRGGGGGGGGRVAIYSNRNEFQGTISGYGGTGKYSQSAGAGTIYRCSKDSPPGDVLIKNRQANGAKTPWAVPVGFVPRSFEIGGGAVLSCGPGQEGLFLMVLKDLTIKSDGYITTNGLGYGPEQGPGAGRRGTGGAAGNGASHGGIGGKAWLSKAVLGKTYDSIIEPQEPGSGGGNFGDGDSSSYKGGAGGGVIHMFVGGQLVVNGSLTADGIKGGVPGAGSGGSILLEAGALEGQGLISAQGGHAGLGGGGGGGRIALYCDSSGFTGQISVEGGYKTNIWGDHFDSGTQGTLYLSSASEWTPLLFNKPQLGETNPPQMDIWTFAANAGRQVRLEAVNSSELVFFDLVGPENWTGFTDLSSDSDTLVLPYSGLYSLIVRSEQEQSSVYSFTMTEETIINLDAGTSYEGYFSGNGHSDLFQVNLAESGALHVSLENNAGDHYTEVYVKYGNPPTRGIYDYRYNAIASSDQEILVPRAMPGDWYILVYGEYVPSPGNYYLTVDRQDLIVFDVTPDYHGNAENMTLTVAGAGFDPSVAIELVNGNEVAYMAHHVEYITTTEVEATFIAATVPAGTYSIYASQGDHSALLADALTVLEGGTQHLTTSLELPNALGYHGLGIIYVEYENDGEITMHAPLLHLTVTQKDRQDALLTLDGELVTQGLWTSAIPEGFSNSIQVLASGNTPGLLHPGESRRIPIYWVGWQLPYDFDYPPFYFHLGTLTVDDDTPMDYEAMEQAMRPADIDSLAWEAIWSNFSSQVGTTWGDYVRMLDENATYLGRIDRNVADISELLAFEFAQANALSILPYVSSSTDASVIAPGLNIVFGRAFLPSIVSRHRLGSLGRSWNHSWDLSLSAREDGTIRIEGPFGEQRIFQPDFRGGYFSQAGDYGQLEDLPGIGYELIESDGLRYAFSVNGQLTHVQDTNGNRITCAYINGLLANLAHSSGQWLRLAYNPAGCIISVTESTGLRTTYSYDGNNEHLLAVEFSDGSVVSCDYNIGFGPALDHSLAQIAYPDNTHQYFNYDAQGRLASTYRDGHAEPLTFTYDTTGMISVTNAHGGTAQYFLDHKGRVGKIENPLGQATYFSHDRHDNLKELTDPVGNFNSYDYDRWGNLTKWTDSLGQITQFKYKNTYNRMTHLIDARDSQTEYTYDERGNLKSIIYADGTVESWAYDMLGNPVAWTNRRGSEIAFHRDAAGQLTGKSFVGQEPITYEYDSRGNLTSYMDRTGTTVLTYNERDRLIRITYPEDRYLAYTYDSAGRRTTCTNQLGHVLTYAYDSVGRLSSIVDADEGSMVHYQYDDTGRLSRKTLGNGVYTAYAYDAASQILSLVNYRPDDTVLSQFDYEYDSLGRRISMTTLEGTWLYEYDDLGQLTAWTDPAGRDVEYVYDALGNRVTEVDNDISTGYTVNNMNQYTHVGNATYTYDSDGNMQSKTDSAGTTTYEYNDENRLVRVVVPSGGVCDYIYDGLGNRVAVIENGVATQYVHDPIGLVDVVGEYTDNGDVAARYVHGYGLTSRIVNIGDAGFYSFDALGNTSEITAETGQIQSQYSYEPFGSVFSMSETLSNPFRFVGEYGVMLEHNNLEFMRARLYDSATGHFVAMDPIGLGGGDLNLYRYVHNQPIDIIDPEGTIIPYLVVAEVVDYGMGLMGLDAGPYSFGTGMGGLLGSATRRSLEDKHIPEFLEAAYGFGEAWWDWQKEENKPPVPYEPSGATREWPYGWRPTKEIPIPTDPNDPNDPNAPPVGSNDPNKKTGPAGQGDEGYIAAGSLMPYMIEFENDANAISPAQIVEIKDPLDTDLDWPTFALTEIVFGDELIPVPEEKSHHFETVMPMSYEGVDFDLYINAGIHLVTGEVYAKFYSVDTETGLPPAINAGFLPPEDGNGIGQGHVNYVIRAREDLPAGTEIRNVAYITFDFAQTIATNQVDPHDPSQGVDPNLECLNTIAYGENDVTLTFSSSDGGSITHPYEGTKQYAPGTEVTLTAAAEFGYHFVGWTGDAVDAGKVTDPASANTSLILDGHYTLQANFALD